MHPSPKIQRLAAAARLALLALVLVAAPGCGGGGGDGDGGTGESESPLGAPSGEACLSNGESCLFDGNLGKQCCSGFCDIAGSGLCTDFLQRPVQ